VTWPIVVVLALAVYALRATGMFIGDKLIKGRVRDTIEYVPMAVIAGVLVLTTFTTGGSLTLDARAAGMAAAGIAVWRNAPLAVVLIIAAATTALVRAVS